ncbi:hypothetical protein Tco_1397367 [Tanacetum coccineum]
MATLKFASLHSMVTFLDKPTESDRFEQIVDFLNTHPIKYALTVNPKIYTSCIKQFWTTAKVKIINGEVQIQALVDKKKVIVTKTSPQKKQQRGKQRKDTEVPQPSSCTEPITDEATNEEHVPTHSNDPLLSGEDRLQLKKLLELCTKLSERVLDLENTKTSQDVEITKLKERVKKLERRNKSRTPRLKRLRKVGRTARIESSKDEDEQEVEVGKVVSTAKVTNVSATTTILDELTLAQTLIEIKAANPKAVTTAATTTTTVVTRPNARGVIVQEPTELEEEERLARQKDEDANIAEWDNVQAMIDADYELAARLQAQ